MSITLTALQKQRTDTAANWTSANPTLLSGELGFESDTGKMKLGNGSTAWNSLAYLILIPSSGVYPGTQLLMPSGTAAAPSISFNGDTNLGIYRSAADTLAISTNGTGRLFVDANGNVGVGTSTPENYGSGYATLEARGLSGTAGGVFQTRSFDATVKGYFYVDSSTNTGRIGTVTNYPFLLVTNSVERARIDSSGRVGIGNSTPGSYATGFNDLVVGNHSLNHGITIASQNTATGRILFADGTGATEVDVGEILYNHANNNLTISTNRSTAITIDSSQRLLLGTSSARTNVDSTTPQVQLEGTSLATSVASIIRNSADSGRPYLMLGKSRGTTVGSNTVIQNGDFLGTINFVGADGTNLVPAAYIECNVDGTPGNNDMPGRLVFSTTADGAASPTERLRITSSGFVGIGTATVNAKLEISGNSGGRGLRLSEPSGEELDISAGAAANDPARIATSGGSGIAFAVNGTSGENARIDSSGRLLVGTSTSITTAIQPYLQVQGTGENAYMNAGRWSNDVNGPGFLFGKSRGGAVGTRGAVTNGDILGEITFYGDNGSSFNNAAAINAFVDGAVSGGGANDMPGRLVFSTTADGASSPTERMRIANDGRHTINSNAHQGSALSTTAPAKLYTSTGTYTDTATAASGTVTHGPIVAFDNPAIAATNTSVTYTNASTVYIDGAPTNGTNVTITNPFSLFIASGNSRFGGNVLTSSATGGIGYATGAGGAVTQATSRTTGVTLNTICGAITLVSAAGSTTWQSFTVTNSTVAATDNVIVNQKSGTDLYLIHVTNIAAGSFRITFATTAGTTTEQPVFNFSVIKAVAA